MIENQVKNHKNDISDYSDVRHKTPNSQVNRGKYKNRSKYLQNKSRNTPGGLKVSKTQESGGSKYKPFSSKMIQSFKRAALKKRQASNENQVN